MTTANTSTTDHLDRFTHPRYLIRRKVFKIFGGAFHVFDDAGNVVLYSKMKAFKLREDIRLYESEAMENELLHISTQSIWDIAGAYDVQDTRTGERIGTLKRSGLSSTFVRDHWTILDPEGNEVGQIQEDSTVKALLRRFVDAAAFLMPQAFHMDLDGQLVCNCKQNFNPFVQKLEVDFTPDTDARLDRRLGLAAAILLLAIEGRQN
ncbi:MAG: hypothetical protein ACODAQ_12890 [Phycisphaeraceae bacterium]